MALIDHSLDQTAMLYQLLYERGLRVCGVAELE